MIEAEQYFSADSFTARSTRAETDPKVFTAIHLHFTVIGEGLKSAQVERAVKLSAEKYCSASIMLGAAAEITHDFAIENDETD